MAEGHPYAARPEAGTHTWLTPREILAPLGRFDLDPCAAPSPRPWPTAAQHIELPDDGLAAMWAGRVWCNPPFGSHTAAWLERMAKHGNGIALAFARADTAMFHRWVWPYASGVLFLAGRPHFCMPDGTRSSNRAGRPSAHRDTAAWPATAPCPPGYPAAPPRRADRSARGCRGCWPEVPR